MGRAPKGKDRLQTINFQGFLLLVSGMVTANNQEQYKKQEELFMTLSKKSSGRLRNRYGSGIGRRRDGMLTVYRFQKYVSYGGVASQLCG